MFVVRDNQGRVVRRCRTEAEARVFVRSAKSPVNSRTIKGAEQIVKAALEKNVIMTVKAPSGDTYTAGPYTPAVRTPTGHGYVASATAARASFDLSFAGALGRSRGSSSSIAGAVTR